MEKTIGQIIREKRTEKGLTQEQLADRLGVTPQAVSKWENDGAYPDVTLLKKLAEELDTSIGALLGEQPKTQFVPPEELDFSKMMLRIRINSNEGDKVSVNFPVAVIEMVVKNEQFMGSITGGKGDVLKSIDFKQILSMVHMGLIGKIVEIQSDDGDSVEVYVE